MSGKIVDLQNKKIRLAVKEAVKKTLLEMGVDASNRAKMIVNVDTGRLRASIGPTAVLPPGDYRYLVRGMKGFTKFKVRMKIPKWEGRGAPRTKLEFEDIKWKVEDWEKMGAIKLDDIKAMIVVGTNVKYALYIEFGKGKYKGNPFLQIAMTDTKSTYEGKIDAVFRKYFINALRRLGLKG